MAIKLSNLEEKMSIRIDTDDKDKVIALAWVYGHRGNYSAMIRELVRTALPSMIERLNPSQQKEYGQNLEQIIGLRKIKETTLIGTPPTED